MIKLPHQLHQLFWKIFATIWAVSIISMTLVFLLLANRNEESRWREVMQARLSERAKTIVEYYETEGRLSKRDLRYLLPTKPWEQERNDRHPRDDGDHHKPEDRQAPLPPIWIDKLIFDQTTRQLVSTEQILTNPRSKPKNTLQLDIQSQSGGQYRFSIALPPTLKHYTGWVTHIFSIQMVLILTVAVLSALLLSFLIVRPIRALSCHVKKIYHEQDFSTRADRALSQRQDELGELTREFDLMASYVERTLLSQQRLLQDVSHEFRAPLARLQICAGLAEQQLGNDNPLVERIDRECNRLDQLISEVLSYSRLDTASDEGESFKVVDLFEELLLDVQFSQPERPLKITIQPEALGLLTNRDLLTRALRNGLENALKYTAPNSLIELTAYESEQQINIVLRDHGTGIDETLLSSIFTPFVRGHNEQWQGYGLGMSIAQRAMSRLKGSIKAENHREGGLQLSYSLPKKNAAS